MSTIIITQLIYVLVFIAVLLAVEGAYLMSRSISRSHQATERRMREEMSQPTRRSQRKVHRHQKTDYGPVSAIIVKVFPAISPYLAQIQGGRISPAIAASFGFIAAIVLAIILQLLFNLPMFAALGAGHLVGLGCPMAVVSIIISSQRQKLTEQLPIAIDLVARGLEAGHPVSVALGMIGTELEAPVGPAFKQALEEVNFGLDRKIALNNLATKYPDTNLRFFVAALEMHRETGGDLAGVLRNLSTVIRKRENLRKKALALSAEGRMTAFLVGGLPFVVIAAIVSRNAEYYTDVFDEPSFWPMMALAFILWAAGITSIWRMTNIKV